MKLKAVISLIIFTVMIADSYCCFAQQQNQFLLNQAVSMALLNNPEVRSQGYVAGTSEADILAETYVQNPYFLFDNGFAVQTYRFGLTKTFELGPKRINRQNIAKVKDEIDGIELNRKILEIKNEIRKDYTDAYVLQEELKGYQKVDKIVNELLKIEKSKKLGSQVDILSVESTELRMRHEIETLAYKLSKARVLIQKLTGRQINENVTLKEPERIPGFFLSSGKAKKVLNKVTQEQLIELALLKRPIMQESYKNLEIISYEEAINRANKLPLMILSGGFEMDKAEPARNAGFFAGNVEIPLLNRHGKESLLTQTRRRTYEAQVDTVKKAIEIEVITAYDSFFLSNSRIERYENILLPALEKNLNESIRLFKVDKAPLTLPINALEAYIEAKIGYFEALSDNQDAISDLIRAVGVDL